MKKHVYKLRRSPKDERDFVYDAESEKLPSKASIVDDMPPALAQLELGSCASNAASNALRYLLHKEHKTEFQPARLYLYWNTRVNVEHSPADEDSGVTLRGMCKAIQKYHVCDEAIWPYRIEKFSVAPPLTAYKNAEQHNQIKYTSVPQTLTAIKSVLARGLPLLFGVSVYDSFEHDTTISTGVVPMPDVNNETFKGGHAILMCGYDDDTRMFTFQNSWGEDVGRNGFFQIPYEYVLNPDLTGDFWALTYFA